MKKILVAVDVARQGGNDTVIKTAQDIAGALGGSLYLLHVIEHIPNDAGAEILKDFLAQRVQYTTEHTQELASQYHFTEAVIREGAPATKILEYAAEIHADLIVLHSHDPDISTYFLGSVASRVVRHAHCSVHVVRQPESEQ